MLQAIDEAKETVCFASFNSVNEEQVFRRSLSSDKYNFVNLLPNSPNDNWLNEVCEQQTKCDHFLVSGHFGGIFFGEHNSNILSLKSMLELSNKKSCESFFGQVKSVYLMGCNTLANKQADHRSLNEYLSILLVDGLPIGLAEEVAATRYLNYGQSIETQFKQVFSGANFIAGFKSTSPLGHQIEPSLQRYFNSSSKKLLPVDQEGFSRLSNYLSWTSFKFVEPDSSLALKQVKTRIESLTSDSIEAWRTLVLDFGVRENLFYLLDTKFTFGLKHLLRTDLEFRKILQKALERAHGELLSYPVLTTRIMSFRKRYHLVNSEEELRIKKLFWDNFIGQRKDLNYVSSSQICDMAEYQSESENRKMLRLLEVHFNDSKFLPSIKECSTSKEEPKSELYQCLRKAPVWDCLKTYRAQLDVPACRYAQSLNRYKAKEDHMLWFCYSNMLEYQKLNQSDCLRLTRSFKHLRNQLHMNWNCMNRL